MHLAGVHAALPLGGGTALLAALAWGAAGRRDDVPGVAAVVDRGLRARG